MYIPYLRGRQYELIAIRTLLEKGLITDKIIPTIEPVKLSRTLLKTLDIFREKNHKIILISNPNVGNFISNIDNEIEGAMGEQYEDYFCAENVTPALIVDEDIENDISIIQKKGIDLNQIATINYDRNSFDSYIENFKDIQNKFNLIPDDRAFGRKIKQNKVLLADRFNKKTRNVDYFDIDEFYSDDHLYFREEGYIGFSDYSIVGNQYSESGFAPYSVAIHFLYFNEDNELYIRHFVSNSNDDIKDPAGKFYEAVTKLAKWSTDKDISTYGYKELIKHYEKGTYPGLGVVKKLCIMHHIELINQYLEAHSK